MSFITVTLQEVSNRQIRLNILAIASWRTRSGTDETLITLIGGETLIVTEPVEKVDDLILSAMA